MHNSTPFSARRRRLTISAALLASPLGATLGALPTVAGAKSSPGETSGPLKIGVIYTRKTTQGQSLLNAANLATEEINATGGINGRIVKIFPYDDNLDPAQGVRGAQRAVQEDGAEVIIGAWSSDVAVALVPWAPRLKVPLLVTGAVSTEVTQLIKKDYDSYKNTYRIGVLNSAFVADAIADYSKDLFKDKLNLKRAVFLTEQANWANPYLERLQSIYQTRSGLEVVDSVRMPSNLADFTTIYQKMRPLNADVLIVGFGYTGLTPTIQWSELRPTKYMAGVDSQVTGADFFEKSHGAADGVMSQTQGANAPITDKTEPFVSRYVKRFGMEPLYPGFTTYDGFYFYKQIVEQIRTTDTEKVVAALEPAQFKGVSGTIAFEPKNSPYPHDTKYGPNFVTGVCAQWQRNKQLKVIWPATAATAAMQT